MSRAVVMVGVSATRALQPYVMRFRESFKKFACSQEMMIWDKHSWPEGSPPHQMCHYAFKVHAVMAAIARGHRQVLWFDSSCYAIRPIEPLWKRLERDGHVLIEDANWLGNFSSDHSLAHFGVTRDEAMTIHLLSGTCWGVNIDVPRSLEFVTRLRELAVPKHFNGTHVSRLADVAKEHPRPGTEGAQMSHDERCWGHRSDEVYMGLLARELGMHTHQGVEFVGGNTVTEHACIRSGYDL